MNKYEKLKRKIEKIDERLDNIVLHNENANEYKKRYKKYIGEILEAIDKQMIPQSNGALLGLMRGISDYEELCSDKKLMKLTYEADKYYSCECKTWD